MAKPANVRAGTGKDWVGSTGGDRDVDSFMLQDPDAGEDRRAGKEFRGSKTSASGEVQSLHWPLAKGADGPDDTGGGTTSSAASKPARSGKGLGF